MVHLIENAWQKHAEDVRRTASARGRRLMQRCSLEGTRVHERALDAATPVSHALISRAYTTAGPRETALLERLAAAGCELHLVPDEVMRELTMGRTFGDVVGLAPIPQPPALDQVAASQPTMVVLVGQDIRDPGNVGALTRTALALGAGAFVGLGCGDVWHPKAVRTSMGAVFRLPGYRFDSVDSLCDLLQAAGFSRVGTVVEQGVPLPQWRRPAGRLALFMGSEAFGLSDDLIQRLDGRITIPMTDAVDSLSVNAAASAAMVALQFQSQEV